MGKGIKIEVVTTPGCVACKRAEVVIEKVKKDFPQLEMVIVDAMKSYGQGLLSKHMILSAPGILINGNLEFTGGMSEDQLRKVLMEKYA
ncbi:MAG: hypothetical protein GOV15_03170 [Candidatus Diapherotrites archaeon]|nr:hypothetical protein [Candidatus Diapherotrites archaeon]